MEIERLAESTVKLVVKKSTIIYNPTDENNKKISSVSAVLLPSVTTDAHFDNAKLTIATPGEYEIEDISIQGIPVAGSSGPLVLYRVSHDLASVVCVPPVSPASLTNQVLEAVGLTDILVVSIEPYNGEFNPVDAAKIVRLLEPRAVIPVGYAKRTEALAKFLSEIGGVEQQMDSFKVKDLPLPGEALQTLLLDVVGL